MGETNVLIHVMTADLTQEDLELFFSWHEGSKWYQSHSLEEWRLKSDEKFARVASTPWVFVGQVSKLSRMVRGERGYTEDRLSPGAVQVIWETIGESLPAVDDEMISKVEAAMRLVNVSWYKVGSREKVVSFLREHVGEKVFVATW